MTQDTVTHVSISTPVLTMALVRKSEIPEGLGIRKSSEYVEVGWVHMKMQWGRNKGEILKAQHG